MQYVVGDTPLLQVTVVDEEDGSAVDLTGGSATLRWRINGGSVQTASMTAIDASNGVFNRYWGSGELSAEGTVLFEVLTIDSSSKRRTSQQFRRNIRRAL